MGISALTTKEQEERIFKSLYSLLLNSLEAEHKRAGRPGRFYYTHIPASRVAYSVSVRFQIAKYFLNRMEKSGRVIKIQKGRYFYYHVPQVGDYKLVSDLSGSYQR